MRTTICILLTLTILSLLTGTNAHAGTIGPAGSSFTTEPYKPSSGGGGPNSGGYSSLSWNEVRNAQEGTLPFNYEYQSGPYVRRTSGTVKDPQGLWQALLPLQPPPGARGGYGLIGDDGLLGQYPGFGLTQLGRIARRYVTFEAIYVVQPPGFSDIGVQEGIFTSAGALNDVTLGWVFFDLRPQFEADLKQLLGVAP